MTEEDISIDYESKNPTSFEGFCLVAGIEVTIVMEHFTLAEPENHTPVVVKCLPGFFCRASVMPEDNNGFLVAEKFPGLKSSVADIFR